MDNTSDSGDYWEKYDTLEEPEKSRRDAIRRYRIDHPEEFRATLHDDSQLVGRLRTPRFKDEVKMFPQRRELYDDLANDTCDSDYWQFAITNED